MPYADPDVRRAYYRSWKKKAGKRLSNKMYDAAKHANQRAEKYGAPGRITTGDVRAVLCVPVGAMAVTVDCFYCRERGVGWLGIDHRVALAVGGANVRENLVPCCHSCNASKMRGDRPRRWAWEHDQCVGCGTTSRPHVSHGRCSSCHQVSLRGTRSG